MIGLKSSISNSNCRISSYLLVFSSLITPLVTLYHTESIAYAKSAFEELREEVRKERVFMKTGKREKQPSAKKSGKTLSTKKNDPITSTSSPTQANEKRGYVPPPTEIRTGEKIDDSGFKKEISFPAGKSESSAPLLSPDRSK